MATTLDPRAFDQTKPLVIATHVTVNGHDLDAGTPLTIGDDETVPGEVDADTAIRLWMSGRAFYSDDALPTPVESRAQEVARTAEIDELDGGWYLLRVPGMDAEKIQGRAAAEERRSQVIAEAGGVLAAVDAVVPDFTAAPTGGGWYEITGPGIDEPLKVQGEIAAAGKLADLREAAGKTSPRED